MQEGGTEDKWTVQLPAGSAAAQELTWLVIGEAPIYRAGLKSGPQVARIIQIS